VVNLVYFDFRCRSSYLSFASWRNLTQRRWSFQPVAEGEDTVVIERKASPGSSLVGPKSIGCETGSNEAASAPIILVSRDGLVAPWRERKDGCPVARDADRAAARHHRSEAALLSTERRGLD
jgi:hypothetical protein